MSADTVCFSKLDPHGQKQVIKSTGGRPNGLAIDGDGLIWIAEAGLRAIMCIVQTGRELKRIDNDGNCQLLFPNDLSFGTNGHLLLIAFGYTAMRFITVQVVYVFYSDS